MGQEKFILFWLRYYWWYVIRCSADLYHLAPCLQPITVCFRQNDSVCRQLMLHVCISEQSGQVSASRVRLKCDGTRAETRFGLSAKRTSPFQLAGASVQSTTGSRGVRISGSNGSNAMFWGRVQDYWLPTPIARFPFTSPTVRYRVPSGFNCALPEMDGGIPDCSSIQFDKCFLRSPTQLKCQNLIFF